MIQTPAESAKNSPLDAPLLALLKLDWEKALYALILVAAIFTRFWDLGARAMSHDESLHALYSWKLYAGEGYRHDPMMHGPFQFHIVALTYFLFGDNDYTARVPAAIFGLALVMLPYFFRRWLGRAGALSTSAMILISPALLFHSRYIRNDILVAVWTTLMILALFKYMESRDQRWLVAGAAALSFSFASKEVTYMTGFIGLTFIGIAALRDALEEEQVRLLMVGGLMVAIFCTLFGVAIQSNLLAVWKEAPVEGQPPVNSLHELVQYLVLILWLVVAAVLSIFLMTDPHQGADRPRPVLRALRAITQRGLLLSILVALVIFALLYSTFFTNPAGFYTGSIGALSYWLEQHGVQRGGQPWYYYFLLLSLYEFLPFLLSFIAIAYYAVKGACAPPDIAEEEYSEVYFIPFVVYWLITTLLLYSWAGEKMPWMSVHLVLPMIFLAGRFVGDIVAGADWRDIYRKGGALLALLLPPVLFAAGVLVARLDVALPTIARLASGEGPSLQKLSAAGSWLAALLVGGALAFAALWVMRRLGLRQSFQVAFATVVLLLALLTVRFAWMLTYINYDYVSEFLMYAHGGPDVKLALGEIEELSRRTVGDKQIKVAYDNDSTWPLEWYFREYPNRAYYADNPTRQAMDSPVVIVGPANESKVTPYLGDRYYRFNYRLIWWPREDYKDWTLSGIWNSLRDPAERQKIWDIFFYRKHERPLTDWPFVHRFAMYVRKDEANQLWDYQTGPVAPPPQEVDPYAQGYRELNSVLSVGAIGPGEGQFLDPRGVAVDKEGFMYVADAGNQRVQVFDGSGGFVRAWGGEGEGAGQFKEPWGIAVGPDGDVYVADTWNHRVQVFDRQGSLLRTWGGYGNTDGAASGAEGLFWGPRALALDAAGDLYVADTGNKRVQKFDRQGKFLGQWGGGGLGPGQFDEPVGLAVDGQGNIYVADTWNRRVQKFDTDFNYLLEWSIKGWAGESVLNKPYLAADSRGRVYATDPEKYRVLVFDAGGTFVATFGQYGTGPAEFALPVGIAVDGEDNIYVVDSGNNRVLKFGPLP
jgi:uncharacterized protein (TIGR03663 family)